MSIFRRGKHAADEGTSPAIELGQISIDRLAEEVGPQIELAAPESSPEFLAEVAAQSYNTEAEVSDLADEAPNQESPSYYTYPGGIQMIDITRHHTGNAAQAIQYIGRATRLDGVTKGSTPEALEEDLDKAINFLNDEKARIRSTE